MGARVWKRDASGEGGQVFTTGFAATVPEAHPRALKRKRVWRLEDQQQGPATPAANGQNGAPNSGGHLTMLALFNRPQLRAQDCCMDVAMRHRQTHHCDRQGAMVGMAIIFRGAFPCCQGCCCQGCRRWSHGGKVQAQPLSQ